MLFHDMVFWVFFAAVLAGFYALPRRVRPHLLLVASYVFYMAWDWRFAGLILASTAVDYVVGRNLPERSPRGRRVLLVTSIAVNLGILGFYKYADFFAASLARLLGADPASWTLGLILPVGVSFYTFQSMSYTIDVYRGRLEPVRDPVDFALFVAFFPQLVAGPIVRAREFFPQLWSWRAPDGLQLREAVQLVLFGLVKKMVFADNAALVADAYFARPSVEGSPVDAWIGVLAFGMQIFFDFSGYTDIARGVAKLLGFEFPVNFRRPYLATSITDFWHRWHISLSTWLRDYLYVPLGGNRSGRLATYRNLMLTMLLGGLWHGAAWTFVVWGAWHGAWLAFERAAPGTDRWPAVLRRASVPIRVVTTFVLVHVGWVLFRASDFDVAWTVLTQCVALDHWVGATTSLAVSWWMAAGLGLAFALAVAEEYAGLLSRCVRAAWPWATLVYLVCFWLLVFFAVVDQDIPYVYFQF